MDNDAHVRKFFEHKEIGITETLDKAINPYLTMGANKKPINKPGHLSKNLLLSRGFGELEYASSFVRQNNGSSAQTYLHINIPRNEFSTYTLDEEFVTSDSLEGAITHLKDHWEQAKPVPSLTRIYQKMIPSLIPKPQTLKYQTT